MAEGAGPVARAVALALAAAAVAVAAPGARPAQQACGARAPLPGYRALFDGTAASLARWAQAGPGGFDLQADCTIRARGGLGLLWYRASPFASPYTVETEWKLPGDTNSGVFVGFPPPGNDPFVAVNRGYEVQIDPTDRPEATTGAIYNFQAADQAVRDRVLRPAGQWNTFEITVDAPRVVVRLNGAVINRLTSTDPARQTLGRGYVGLQNHSDADRILYRSAQVNEWGAERPRCARRSARRPGDSFAGGRLDGCRWNRIVRYDGGALHVGGGALQLELTDDARPTNLVLQRAPASDWTIETAVRAPRSGEAGLLAHRTDSDSVRLVAGSRIGLVSTRCGAVARASAPRPRGTAIRLRLRRTGARYTGFFSRDGRRWARVGSVVNPRLGAGASFGVAARGPSLSQPPARAAFDRFAATPGRRVSPAAPACP